MMPLHTSMHITHEQGNGRRDGGREGERGRGRGREGVGEILMHCVLYMYMYVCSMYPCNIHIDS